MQIAHNVNIGRGCVITGQVGISGSVKIGDFAVFGGQSGVADHLTIGSGVQVAAKAGVLRDIKDGEAVAGYPAVSAWQHMRQVLTLRHLVKKNNDSKKKEAAE